MRGSNQQMRKVRTQHEYQAASKKYDEGKKSKVRSRREKKSKNGDLSWHYKNK